MAIINHKILYLKQFALRQGLFNIQMDKQSVNTGYQYDIFLSYTRNFIGDWVHEHFLELFNFHLQGGLGYSPKVFVDTQDISAGESWPLRLKKALAYSKCLVAILSPSYFESNWCLKECHVMLYREHIEGFGAKGNGQGLVLPVIASDGKYFPDYIRNIQSVDFRNFVRKGSGFPTTPRYVEFQDKMEQWAKEVADAVRNAPTWNSSWLDETIINIPKLKIPDFNTPPRLG